MISLIGASILFEEADAVSSGHFDSVEWVLDDDGTLTISGSGELPALYYRESFSMITSFYDYDSKIPWDSSLIKKIIIGDSITSVGTKIISYYSTIMGTFIDCENLESVVIGKSVAGIGDNAFNGCSSLKTVVINGPVSSIGSSVFEGCNSLKSIQLNNASSNLVLVNGDLYDKDMERLIACSADKFSLIVPEGVKKIDGGAIRNSLVSITLPTTLNSVPNNNSYDEKDASKYLAEVINYSSINIEVGKGFAKYASSVKVVGTTDIVNVDGLLFLNTKNFCQLVGCFGENNSLSLTDKFEGNKYSVKDYAFYENDKITSVVFGDPVTRIGRHAFEDCSALSTVVIGNSVSSIGYEAFLSCDLSNVSFGKQQLSFEELKSGYYQDKYTSSNDPYLGFGDYFYDETGVKLTQSSQLCNHTYALTNGRLVQVAYTPVTDISLDKQSLILRIDDTSKISVTISPNDSSNKSVLWKTSDSSIATVDQNGNVKGISEGKATITATSVDSGKTALCSVTVKSASPTPPQESSNPSDSSGSDNTMLYVCIAAVIIILMALAAIIMKRRSKL